MDLKFSKNAKHLRDALNSGDVESLCRLYSPVHAELIMIALQSLRAARNLNDIMGLKTFSPHALTGNLKNVFSMAVGGRKRLLIKTLGVDGKPTKKVDFKSNCGLIVEVSEHYGD